LCLKSKQRYHRRILRSAGSLAFVLESKKGSQSATSCRFVDNNNNNNCETISRPSGRAAAFLCPFVLNGFHCSRREFQFLSADWNLDRIIQNLWLNASESQMKMETTSNVQTLVIRKWSLICKLCLLNCIMENSSIRLYGYFICDYILC